MSNARKPRSGADLLRKTKPQLAEQTVKICLRPDLLDEYNKAVTDLDDITDELQQAKRAANASKGGRMASRTSPAEQAITDRQAKAAERVRAVEQQMAKHEVEFTLRSMPKDRWRDLVDANPPREDNQVDLFTGYHRDAVLDAAVRPSLIDPEFDDCDTRDCNHDDCYTWQMLVKLLNAGQWNRLRDTANAVNNGVAEVPKSQEASDILSKVAAASKQPADGPAPPPAGSKAGSRSRSSST